MPKVCDERHQQPGARQLLGTPGSSSEAGSKYEHEQRGSSSVGQDPWRLPVEGATQLPEADWQCIYESYPQPWLRMR